jgi:hypothetical protein
MASPNLWGFKKLFSKPFPIQGAASVANPGQLKVDLKDVLQHETVSRLMVRVFGTINEVFVAVGAATGRDNPEALIVNVTAQSAPALGLISKNNLTARGMLQMGIFDRGYSFHATPIVDLGASGPALVDFTFPLQFKQPGSVNPIEWGLPMALFTSYVLTINFGGREQLFAGGTNTWDLSGLVVEVWADYDDGVAGNFHLIEEFEVIQPVLQTQSDLQVLLQEGFYYTHLLFIAQTANAKDDTLINGITVQSAGRVWTPQGDKNAKIIQRWNRETHVNAAAESLVGTYFIPALRDGMYTRAIDATISRLEIKLDVTLGGGPSNVIIRGRKLVPKALQVLPAAVAI